MSATPMGGSLGRGSRGVVGCHTALLGRMMPSQAAGRGPFGRRHVDRADAGGLHSAMSASSARCTVSTHAPHVAAYTIRKADMPRQHRAHRAQSCTAWHCTAWHCKARQDRNLAASTCIRRCRDAIDIAAFCSRWGFKSRDAEGAVVRRRLAPCLGGHRRHQDRHYVGAGDRSGQERATARAAWNTVCPVNMRVHRPEAAVTFACSSTEGHTARPASCTHEQHHHDDEIKHQQRGLTILCFR